MLLGSRRCIRCPPRALVASCLASCAALRATRIPNSRFRLFLKKMFSKRVDERAAEDVPTRPARIGMPSCASRVRSLDAGALGSGRQRRRRRRRAECLWAARSPRAFAVTSGAPHLSRLAQRLSNGHRSSRGSDCHARASLVSIPETCGTRLGPIGVSPNIVVTIAALGDPCLQS